MKKDSNITSVEKNTKTDDLPEGWMAAALPEVCTINPAKPPVTALPPDALVTFVPMPAVDEYLGAVTKSLSRPFAEVRKGFTAFQEDDVIMAKITPCMENGKAAVVRNLENGLGFGSTEFHVFRSNGAVLPEYVYQYIRQESYRRDAESEMTGSVGQKRVPVRFLEHTVLPLPPLSEQKRITTTVGDLLVRRALASDRLDKVSNILKAFRQSILAAACSGRLTEDWREGHPEVEPAAKLLFRIEDGVKQNKRTTSSDGTVNDEDDSALPETWVQCKLEQLFSIQTGATPLRKNAAYYAGGTVPWVKTGEVHNCDIFQAEEFITDLAVKETNAKLFPPGTILIAMYGEGKTRGQVGRLRIPAATNQACAALVNTKMPQATQDYVYSYCLGQYDRLREKAFGGNQPNLSLGVIKGWGINLPPLEEQIELVRRLGGSFQARRQN